MKLLFFIFAILAVSYGRLSFSREGIPPEIACQQGSLLEVSYGSIILLDYQMIDKYPDVDKKIQTFLDTEFAKRKDGDAFSSSITGKLKDEVLEAIGLTQNKKIFVGALGEPKVLSYGNERIPSLWVGANLGMGKEKKIEPWLNTVVFVPTPLKQKGRGKFGLAFIGEKDPFNGPLEEIKFQEISTPLFSNQVIEKELGKGKAIEKVRFFEFKSDGIILNKVTVTTSNKNLEDGSVTTSEWEGYFVSFKGRMQTLVRFYEPHGGGEMYPQPMEYLYSASLNGGIKRVFGIGKTNGYDPSRMIFLSKNGTLKCQVNKGGYVD